MKAFANRRGPRAVTLTLFLGFAGCPGTGEYTNTGEEGSRPAQRIVSLVPSVTEVLLELGAAERLVARTDSDESPALAHLPSVGDVLTPNLEAIVASEPDLVVAWSGIDTSPLERAMSGGGRVRTTSIDRLADIDRAIRDVGSWIDEEVAAEELRRSFTATLRAADRTVTDGERPSVLWVVWSDPIVVAGPATFLSDLIDLVGGCNAAMQAGSRWPQLGPEPLLRRSRAAWRCCTRWWMEART